MSTSLIVGTVILVGVMIWLMVLVTVTVVRHKPISIPPEQYGVIRFLCTMAAGAGGGLFANGLTITLSGEISTNLQVVASGAGAAGLALLVWATFSKVSKSEPPDWIRVLIPGAWSFQQAAMTVAKIADAAADLSAFTPAELQTPMGRDCTVQGKDGESALSQLSKAAPPGVRKFVVRLDSNSKEYRLAPQA